MKTYVTYGLGNKFDISKLHVDLKCFVGKPRQAWWGSPIDAKFGWKEWCESEDWLPEGNSFETYFLDNNKIFWTLEDNSKILYINEVKDLDTFLKLKYIIHEKEDRYANYIWDFNKVLEDGYDAIELTDSMIGHYFISMLERIMNGWDCESIVVINPTKIIQI